MSALQRAVLADLLLHGPCTAKVIAERIGRKHRAVTTCLCWLRGNGWVSDGSIVVGAQLPLSWEPGKKPAQWEIMFEPLPLMAVWHGKPR